MNKTIIILILLSSLAFGQSKKVDFDKLDDAIVLVLGFDELGNSVSSGGYIGSGFFIDDQGTIVTNYHVVENIYLVRIKTEDGTIYDVEKIISGSKEIDLVKLQIKKSFPTQKFPYLKTSKSFPKKNDDVIAIGTPLFSFFMNTLSKGVVSKIHYSGLEPWSTDKIIQINADIQHGSSGGALLNEKGEVIGITCGGEEELYKRGLRINYAIWVEELERLPVLYLDRIFDESLLKGKVAFYLNYLLEGDNIFLYVDGNLVGKFDSFFSTAIPTCEQEGTINGAIQVGQHNYIVRNYVTGRAWVGVFEVSIKECQIIGLDNRPKEKQKDYNDEPHVILRDGGTNYVPSVQLKKRGARVGYNSMISFGTSVIGDINSKTFTATGERYLKNPRLSVRGVIEYANKPQDFSKDIQYSLIYNSIGADIKIIKVNEYFFWNWYGAAGLNFRYFNKDYSKPIFIQNGVYLSEPIYLSDKRRTFGIVPSLKLGSEIHLTNRLCASAEFGFGYNTGNKIIGVEMKAVLGYRFDLKN